MRNFQLPALMLIVVLTFFQRQAQAQESKTNRESQTNSSQAVNSELREKAFVVLESLAEQVNSLQSAENRARIGANLAESLWKRDEARARALFVLVQEDIKSRLVLPENQVDAKELQNFQVFLKLRSDTVERIARCDAELAFSFFKATEVDLEKLPHYLIENERDLDVRLAQKLAAQNPEVSIRLARVALARGFSEGLLVTIMQLGGKHKEHALVLFKEIVQKLRKSDLRGDWQARQFVFSLANNFQPPMIDETAFKDFVAFLVTTAAANGCDGKSAESNQDDFCQWIPSVLANVEKFDPRPLRIRQRSRQRDEGEFVQAPEGLTEVEVMEQEGTIDGLLALAGKYPDLAEQIQWRALMMARNAGDLERMRKIAEEFKGHPQGRQQMLDEVAQVQRAVTFDEEQLAELEKLLNETRRLEERVMLLVSAAYRAGISNRKMALKLLNRAEQVVETMNPGKEQSFHQMGVAISYCLEKDERGFVIMESLVPKLNSLIDAAIKLDGYDTTYLREGEWNMSAVGSLGELLTQLSQAAGLFAWSDFERAISLAGQFERTEIRMMAQLKLAQSILAGPYKRTLFR